MDLKQRFASVVIVGALAFTGAFAAMPVFAQDGEPAAEASEATPQVTDQVATQADTAIEVQLYALSSCSICGKSHSVIPVEGGDSSITDHHIFTAEDLFGEDSGLQVDVSNVEQTGGRRRRCQRHGRCHGQRRGHRKPGPSGREPQG